MEEALRGWKDRKGVKLPPLEHQGFAQDIIMRRSVAPVQREPEKEPVQKVLPERESMQKALPEQKPMQKVSLEKVRPQDVSDEGEGKTVLLAEQVRHRAFLCRICTGEKAEVCKSPFVIGKSSGCDYVVKDNTTVSRRHAQILSSPEGYLLEDLGSSNHTFVEDVQIAGVEELQDGTRFRLSDEEFRFSLEIG